MYKKYIKRKIKNWANNKRKKKSCACAQTYMKAIISYMKSRNKYHFSFLNIYTRK